jgi:hypothetical protein
MAEPGSRSVTEWPLWRAFLAPFAALPGSTIAAVLAAGEARPTKWALIVEPRPHALLVAVVKHVAALLGPRGWGLVVMHGAGSAEGLRAALPASCPRLVLAELPVDDLPLAGYSALLLKPFVWRNLVAMGASQALVFQTDTVVLDPARVAAFAAAGWDYVGAPWSAGAWGAGRTPTHPVGNGGFSLRDPATMLRIAEALEAVEGEEGAAASWARVAREVRDSGAPEDVVFSRACVEMGARVPSAEVAASFAAETVHHPDPAGLHNPASLPQNALLLYLARRWDLGRWAARDPAASPPRLLPLSHPRDGSAPESLMAELPRADALFSRANDPEAAARLYARHYRALLRLVGGLRDPAGAPSAPTLRQLHLALRRTLSYCWAPPADLLADLPAEVCRLALPAAWPAPHERAPPRRRAHTVRIGDREHVIEIEEKEEGEGKGPGKIRLGYVGPDFNRNAVGLFVAPLLRHHDPSRFEVFVYDTGAVPGGDAVGAHLRASSAANVTWVAAGALSDDALADLMRREHRLDVLVDLIAGGVGGRPDLAARRPAAAVVNYLGFPELVGMPGVYTHRISDPLVEPPPPRGAAGSASFGARAGGPSEALPKGRGKPAANRPGPSAAFGSGSGSASASAAASAERLVLLREAPFVCYAHWEAVYPSPPIRPRGPSGAFTRAGLFARAHKHHPRFRELLASALSASPALRLVVKDDSSHPLRALYPASRFPRTTLLPFADSHADFMARFNEVEFVADSMPYSGTTITCAALYMGVPVLCALSPSARHVSRVSGGLMLHVQRTLDARPDLAAQLPARLDETFVVPSPEAYAARLAELGSRDGAWWAAWRRGRGALSAAFRETMDPARFVADLERALEEIHCG